MIKNAAFALLFCCFFACSPRQYFDSTGQYTHLSGKEYIREGDSLTMKGYPVYRLGKVADRNFGGKLVRITKR